MPTEFLGKLYLASASPRRRELLAQLGLDFQVVLSARKERPHPAKIKDFKDLSIVIDIAAGKAMGAWEKFGRRKPNAGLILAADTLVFLGDRVLGKPKTEKDARKMLRSLSGQTHTVATGVSLLRILDSQIHMSENRMVTTNVTFAELSDSDIDWYVRTKQPMDKAGAYGAQDGGASFIEKISGSYTNVVGLPLTETMALIGEVSGVPWQAYARKKKMNARDRLAKVLAEISDACAAAGRSKREVRLVAVGKTKPWEALAELAEAGQCDFGENYVQEALDKMAAAKAWAGADRERAALLLKLRWHFIGHLQSNKAKNIPGNFVMLHSLDRAGTAEALDREAARKNTEMESLVQVNVDGEVSKSGVAAADLARFLEHCNRLNCVRIVGLMCIPDPEKQKDHPRRAFAAMRELLEKANASGAYKAPLRELSMGMSADFRDAILEGSTIVRVGTALFGAREAKA